MCGGLLTNVDVEKTAARLLLMRPKARRRVCRQVYIQSWGFPPKKGLIGRSKPEKTIDGCLG